MTISIKPTASGSTIEQDGSQVLSIESDRSVDIDSGTLHVDATNNRVGIGTTTPSRVLHTVTSGDTFIRIQGGVSNAKGIEINDGTTIHSQIYSVSSDLRFFNNSAERMRIYSNGAITKPYQPAFFINGNTGTVTVSAGAAVPFNTSRYDNGNNFNTSTYTFTAPVAGAYFFNASMYIQGGVSICFFKNGSQYLSPTPLIKSSGSDQYDSSRSMSILLNLAANDTVAVHSRGTQSSIVYTPHSSFSGFLIG